MNRRNVVYKKNNFSENGSPVLETFFKDNKIPILKLEITADNGEEIFKKIKIFIETGGKFENYQTFEKHDE